MKKINPTNFIIPAYLVIVLLLQINLTIKNTLFVLLPILLIVASIYLKNNKIGIIGLFLFFTVSIGTIIITTIENYVEIFLEIIFLILPSIILIGQILQIENVKKTYTKPVLKPIILSIILFIIVILFTYIICIFLWDGFLLSAENLEGQILIIASVSIVCCLPFLIFQKVKKIMA